MRSRIILLVSIVAGAVVVLIGREVFDSRAVVIGLGVITAYLVNGELGDIFGPKPPPPEHDPNAPPQPLLANPRVRRRLATLAALTGAALLVGLGFLTSDLDVEDVRQWILDLGAWGPILLITALAVAMVIAPIPNPPFMIAAGIAWGTVLGVVYCVIGQLIGSMIIFVLSRKFGRRFIPRLIGAEAAERVDSLALRMGPHLVFWWRMMPISFDFAAYAAGLTTMRFRQFVLLTGIGSIVPTTVVVGFGNSFGKSWEAVLVTGLLVVVAVSVCAFFFYREFREEIGTPRQAFRRFLGGESSA